MTCQSMGRAAKSFFVFIYHPIPFMGFFHLPCISFKALWCVSSPPATTSFKCLSCAFMTSSAVFPWNAVSQGPPICLHVIVFINITPFVHYPKTDAEPLYSATHTYGSGNHNPEF